MCKYAQVCHRTSSELQLHFIMHFPLSLGLCGNKKVMFYKRFRNSESQLVYYFVKRPNGNEASIFDNVPKPGRFIQWNDKGHVSPTNYKFISFSLCDFNHMSCDYRL